MLIDVIQKETGQWFFFVDIVGVLYDQIMHRKIMIYSTKSGYSVCFEK
jgi:hypothetical protein